jgi:hypothetical protein
MLLQRISNVVVLRRLCMALLAFALAAGPSSSAEAASKRAKKPTKSKTSAKAAAKAKADAKAEQDSAAIADARVAVFAFDGEDPYSVRKHVIKALTDRGLKVEASLKSPDTAEQFRDMGAALNLSVYIHGHIKETAGDHAVATLTVRSAVTGRKLTTAAFNGFRRGLPFDIEEQLWDRIGKAVAQACVEASKPGRRHNEPMRINAGTPL